MRELTESEYGQFVNGGGFCPACYYAYFVASFAFIGLAVTRFNDAGMLEKMAYGTVLSAAVTGVAYVGLNQLDCSNPPAANLE